MDIQFRVHSATTAKTEADAFYAACGSERRVEIEDTLVSAYYDNEMIANVRLCSTDGHHVLRSMRVSGSFQRQGLGLLLLKKFEAVIRERAIGEIFCIPWPYLEGFYGTIGFKKIDPKEAPGFLQKRLEKMWAEEGSDSGIIMRRRRE